MSHTCQCPAPPGGQVTCEAQQLAVCSVRNGVVDASCHTPPPAVVRAPRQLPLLTNWALAVITGEARAPMQPVSIEEQMILRRGEFMRDDGTFVLFRLPHARPEGEPSGGVMQRV